MDGSDAVNWGGWQPGLDTGASTQLLDQLGQPPAYRALLQAAGMWAASIIATRLRAMARALLAGARGHASPSELEAALTACLDADAVTERIALTELGRAQAAAAMETYRRAGIRQHQWVTEKDERVCPICAANAAAGPVQIGMPFPSGDVSAPAHGRCRCATVAVPN